MKLEEMDAKYAVYGMLFSLSNRIQAIGDKEFDDITLKQHFVLGALNICEEPPTLKEMGTLIGCSYQNVKRMALHLERAGYIKLVPDEKDKRKLLLVPTEKIEKMAEEKKEATLRFMERLYQGISEEEIKTALAILNKMEKNLGGTIK